MKRGGGRRERAQNRTEHRCLILCGEEDELFPRMSEVENVEQSEVRSCYEVGIWGCRVSESEGEEERVASNRIVASRPPSSLLLLIDDLSLGRTRTVKKEERSLCQINACKEARETSKEMWDEIQKRGESSREGIKKSEN